MNFKFSILLLLFFFFLLLFSINYYDFFYILGPVRSGQIGGGNRPVLFTYVFYNFSFRLIFYSLKFISLTLLLYGFSILWNLKSDNNPSLFKEIFSLVVILEFIYFFEKIYKIFYFEFINADYTFEDYIQFYPLSFYSSDSSSSSVLNQISKDFSVFDLVYIFFMILEVRSLFDISIERSIQFSMTSYVLPLIIWVIFLHFIGFG